MQVWRINMKKWSYDQVTWWVRKAMNTSYKLLQQSKSKHIGKTSDNNRIRPIAKAAEGKKQ